MRILTKKRYQFGSGDTKVITAGNYIIEDVPDWVKNDPLFILAKNDGDIEVMQTKPQIQVEKAEPTASKEAKQVTKKEESKKG